VVAILFTETSLTVRPRDLPVQRVNDGGEFEFAVTVRARRCRDRPYDLLKGCYPVSKTNPYHRPLTVSVRLYLTFKDCCSTQPKTDFKSLIHVNNWVYVALRSTYGIVSAMPMNAPSDTIDPMTTTGSTFMLDTLCFTRLRQGRHIDNTATPETTLTDHQRQTVMSDIGRWVVWGLLPSLIAGLLINALISFETIDSAVFGIIISDPILRVTGLTIALVAPFYFGINYIVSLTKAVIDRRKEIRSSNTSGGLAVPSRPSSPVWHGVIRHYGADWFVTVGTNRSGNPYSYIDSGPCCPKCQTEMLRRTEPKFLVLKHQIWLCPNCETVVERPEDMLFKENKGVKNIAKKHVTTALNVEDPEAFVFS